MRFNKKKMLVVSSICFISGLIFSTNTAIQAAYCSASLVFLGLWFALD